MVFPLGMYATATWRLAEVLALPALAAVARGALAVALLAWAVTAAGLVRAAARARPGPAPARRAPWQNREP
jgi:tellurite resistance protein TehA-like permease